MAAFASAACGNFLKECLKYRSDFSKLLADATVEEEAAEKEYEKISQENRVATAMKDADVKYKTKEAPRGRRGCAR